MGGCMTTDGRGDKRRGVRLRPHEIKAAQNIAKGKPPPPDTEFGQPNLDPIDNAANEGIRGIPNYQFPTHAESRWYVGAVMEDLGVANWAHFGRLLAVPTPSTITRWKSKSKPARPSNLYLWRMGVLQLANRRGYPVKELYRVMWDSLPMFVIWETHSQYAKRLAESYKRGKPRDGFAYVDGHRDGILTNADFLVPDLLVSDVPCPECGGEVAAAAARGDWECAGCAAYLCSRDCLYDHANGCADYAETAAAVGDDGEGGVQRAAGKGEPQKPSPAMRQALERYNPPPSTLDDAQNTYARTGGYEPRPPTQDELDDALLEENGLGELTSANMPADHVIGGHWKIRKRKEALERLKAALSGAPPSDDPLDIFDASDDKYARTNRPRRDANGLWLRGRKKRLAELGLKERLFKRDGS